MLPALPPAQHLQFSVARLEKAKNADSSADDRRDAAAPDADADSDAGDANDPDAVGIQPATAIVVTARRLDAARTRISPDLGATSYSLTNDTIEDRPGGETGSIGSILTQTPGVTLSGSGLKIRGSKAIQVRINNVALPEAISDPGDRISSRFAQSTRVVTGTLPAQFGFAPGGVIAVTTKNGLYQHGGQLEFFGGNHAMAEPAIEWASSRGSTSLFGSGSYETGDTPVADLAGNSTTDRRREFGAIAFADHVLDKQDRVSAIFGGSSARNLFAATALPAGAMLTQSGYAVGTWQHSTDNFTLQTSLFGGWSRDRAQLGSYQQVLGSSLGTQIDATYDIGNADTVLAGLLLDHSTNRLANASGPVDRAQRTAVGVYLQNQFKPAHGLQLNTGLRIDWVRGMQASAMFEPRASVVWNSDGGFSVHAGYARYAAAPPLGESDPASPLPDEHDDYFGAGVQQQLGDVTLGVEGYWRSAHHLYVEHRTISSAEPAVFAFRKGRFRGVELSATYSAHRLDAWANVSFSEARGSEIEGSGSLFAPSVVDASAQGWVPLASDRPVSGSAGVTLHADTFDVSADMTAGSGIVTTAAGGAANGSRAPAYASFGLSGVYNLRLFGMPADIRVDLLNLTNRHYITSDAANLEGGWTRYDQGRTVLVGIEQAF